MIFGKLRNHYFKEFIVLYATLGSILTAVLFFFKMASSVDFFLLSKNFLLSLNMLVVFITPTLFKYTAPMSILLAAYILGLRISHDQEWEAWLSFGGTPGRLLLPIAVASGFLGLLCMGSTLYFEPFARQQWHRFKWVHTRQAVENIIENKIKEKTFVSQLFHAGNKKISFYADNVSPSKTSFTSVYLSIKDNEKQNYHSIIYAKTGSIQKQMNGGIPDYVFILNHGSFYRYGEKQDTWNRIDFKDLSFSLFNIFQKQFDFGRLISDDPRTKYPNEYLQMLKKIRTDGDWFAQPKLVRHFSFFYEQLIFPLSCPLLGGIGFLMGMKDNRRKQSSYTLFIIMILFYYTIIMFSQQLSFRLILKPEVSLWLPITSLGLIFFLLLRHHSQGFHGLKSWSFLKRKT